MGGSRLRPYYARPARLSRYDGGMVAEDRQERWTIIGGIAGILGVLAAVIGLVVSLGGGGSSSASSGSPTVAFRSLPAGTSTEARGEQPGDSESPATYSPPEDTVILDVPSSFLGRWQGVFHYAEGSDVTPVNMTITGGRLGSKVGTNAFPAPDQNCTEDLTLVDTSATRLVFSETYASGSTSCGEWTIVISQKGALLSGEWYLGSVDESPDGTASFQKVDTFS